MSPIADALAVGQEALDGAETLVAAPGGKVAHAVVEGLGWLAEAEVELPAHPTGHMGDDAVQRDSLLFVLVKA